MIQSQQIQRSRRGSGGAAAAAKLTRRYSDVVLAKTCHLTALISLASSSLTHSRRTSASTDYSWFHGSRSLSGMTHAPFPLLLTVYDNKNSNGSAGPAGVFTHTMWIDIGNLAAS